MRRAELTTTDSLLSILPENACYMASSDGVTVVLSRTPDGGINAAAISMSRDSTIASHRVMYEVGSEHRDISTENNQVTTKTEEVKHSRSPTWMVHLAVVLICLTVGVAFLLMKWP